MEKQKYIKTKTFDEFQSEAGFIASSLDRIYKNIRPTSDGYWQALPTDGSKRQALARDAEWALDTINLGREDKAEINDQFILIAAWFDVTRLAHAAATYEDDPQQQTNAWRALSVISRCVGHLEILTREPDEHTTTDREARQRNARHAATSKNKAAREWVQAEWAEHRKAYDNNKTRFAQDYSRRLAYERGATVSERQIREEWLRMDLQQ